MLKSIALATALLPCMAVPAYADHRYVDTETLYGWCKPRDVSNPSVGHYCAGYISAMADVVAHNHSIHEHRACVPEHVNLADLRSIVVTLLENRPKDADKDGHDWVAMAFAEKFPCKR